MGEAVRYGQSKEPFFLKKRNNQVTTVFRTVSSPPGCRFNSCVTFGAAHGSRRAVEIPAVGKSRNKLFPPRRESHCNLLPRHAILPPEFLRALGH